MKKFIIKASLFIFLIVFTIFGVVFLLPVDKNKYLGATIDKHRLLEVTPQPRIIFAGDSNIAFGLDSAKIKAATGYNIVNMGLHGGLGLIYYMDELKPHLKKNDIVIFILDCQNYLSDGSGYNSIIEITLFNPKILKYYSLKNYYNFIISMPLAFNRRLRGALFHSGDDMAFVRTAFNEYGDNVGHLNLPQPKLLTAPRTLPTRMEDNSAKLFNDFYDLWTPRGVKVYLSFSPLLQEDRAKQERELNSLYVDIKKRLKLTVIGLPANFIYPADYFYDNIFHLHKKGREIRTQELIKAMKQIPELAAAPKINK